MIHDTSLDNQTDITDKFTTGAWSHTLLAGLELGHDTYKNQAYTRGGLPLSSSPEVKTGKPPDGQR